MKQASLSAFLLLCSLITAQLRLETTISPDTITVGDQVFLKIQAEHADSIQVNFMDLTTDSPEMSIVDHIITEKSVTYILKFWEVGSVTIPEIPVQALSGGKLLQTIFTDSITVKISSILDDSASDFKDIKGMQDISLKKSRQQIIFYSLLVISALAAFLLWYRRKVVVEKAEKWSPPPVPPHIQAKDLLENLNRPYPITDKSAEKYYLEISRIFREYFENEFFIKSLEMTTSEFLEYLEQADYKQSLKDETRILLEKSDLSKFARHIPTDLEFDHDKQVTQDLINLYHNVATARIQANSTSDNLSE